MLGDMAPTGVADGRIAMGFLDRLLGRMRRGEVPPFDRVVVETTGLADPVPIVAVMAGQARQIGLVASAGNRSSGQVAKELGMAPFMVDKARRMMRGWDGERLGAAVTALARCDHEVKGAARDPHSAVERVVDEICRLHG